MLKIYGVGQAQETQRKTTLALGRNPTMVQLENMNMKITLFQFHQSYKNKSKKNKREEKVTTLILRLIKNCILLKIPAV